MLPIGFDLALLKLLKAQFSTALVIQLDAHALLMLQAHNDDALCQRDLSEHDRGSIGIRYLSVTKYFTLLWSNVQS